MEITAANSSAADKALADVVCSGTRDEDCISAQIAKLTQGGTIQFFDGSSYIDSFEHEGNTAIYFGYNNGDAIVGNTKNKAYTTHFD